METTLLIAASRQAALNRELTVVANNLANTNTSGFKAARMLYETYPVRSRGEHLVRDKLAFVQDARTVLDTREGGLTATGNPLDIALRGDGFLVVDTAEGQRFTRLGRLHVDPAGTLVTAQAEPVLSAVDQPIVVGADAGDITITRDGTVATASGPVGRLKVVGFSRPDALKAAGDAKFSAVETPRAAARVDVVQGMLESSNVEPVREITRMIDVQRAYDRTRKMIDDEDDRLKTMIKDYTK